jgi:hypothetical protein
MKLNTKTISGFALIGIGAWVALAQFIVGNWAWEWDLGRFALTVLPGAVVALGGLMLLTERPQLVTAGGALAVSAGVWLVVGPLLHALVAGPELGTTPEGGAIRMLEMLPFFLGAGVLVTFVSAYAAGFLKPLEFADDMWLEETSAPRARVPMAPERPRRQRAAGEAAQPQPHRGSLARRER